MKTSEYPPDLQGLEILAVQQLRGTFYVFTKNAIYTMRQPRWYDPFVKFIQRFARWTQKPTKS